MSAPDADKRAKAFPRTVKLLECPECHEFGVPENERYKFCLKCKWHAPLPPLKDES